MRLLPPPAFLASVLSVLACAADPEIIDDAALTQRLEQGSAALVGQGRTRSLEQLAKGLTRDVAPFPLPSSPDPAHAPEEIYRLRRSGVLVLAEGYKCGKCNRLHQAIATALALTPDGLCLTNRHVFVPNPEREVKSMVAMTAAGEVLPVVEVLGGDKEADLALFRVDPGESRLAALPLGASPAPGARVTVIGHPADRFFSLSTGVVTRHARLAHGPERPELLFIDADFARGSSGSPVFDDAGFVVGMVTFTQPVYYEPDKQANQQMVFKACVPIHRIRRFLAGGGSAQ